MGFTRACRMAFSGSVSRKTRLLALASVAGCCYLYLMVAVTVCLGVLEVVPSAFKSSPRLHLFNNILIAFLFVNVLGNYLNAYTTDSSVRTLEDTNITKTLPKKPGTLPGTTSSMFLCKKCKLKVPERSHHCALCESCVLKRDHHCFFLAKCVGYHNQRYFIVFCLYMFVAGLYATVLLACHLNSRYSVRFNHVFSVLTLLPQTLWCWICELPTSESSRQMVTAHQMFLTGVFYGCLCGGLAAGGFFSWQMGLVINGQTTFEARRNISRFAHNSKWENYKDVFGHRWLIIWFMPLRYHLLGQGVYVSTVKVLNNKKKDYQ